MPWLPAQAAAVHSGAHTTTRAPASLLRPHAGGRVLSCPPHPLSSRVASSPSSPILGFSSLRGLGRRLQADSQRMARMERGWRGPSEASQGLRTSRAAAAAGEGEEPGAWPGLGRPTGFSPCQPAARLTCPAPRQRLTGGQPQARSAQIDAHAKHRHQSPRPRPPPASAAGVVVVGMRQAQQGVSTSSDLPAGSKQRTCWVGGEAMGPGRQHRTAAPLSLPPPPTTHTLIQCPAHLCRGEEP